MFIKNVPPILMSNTLLHVQCILFLVLNFLDGYSTWLVLKPDHYHRERNPIARWVFRKLKAPFSIVFFKVFLLSLLGIFFAYWWRESLTLNIGLLIGNLLYIYVVQHNFKVYRQNEKVNRDIAELYKRYRVTE